MMFLYYIIMYVIITNIILPTIMSVFLVLIKKDSDDYFSFKKEIKDFLLIGFFVFPIILMGMFYTIFKYLIIIPIKILVIIPFGVLLEMFKK